MGMPVITPSNISREEAITDIIESIALMEAGLSHILNAEGEKIQAVNGTLSPANPSVVATTSAELLAVNKSVEEMVSAITMLEIILEKKLSSVHCQCRN